MSNYSDTKSIRRKSPDLRQQLRSKHQHSRSRSRSRSPHYEPSHHELIRSRRELTNRSRSPPMANHYYQMRPMAYATGKRVEEEHVRYNPPENKVLAIFGLSRRVIEQDLFDLYRGMGGKECKVIIDKHNGCPKGYGFVYFSRTKDAIIAREKTDGIKMFEKPIRVDFSIGERDYGTSPAIASSTRSHHPRDSRDYRDFRERPPPTSHRYIAHEIHQRSDPRMPRESMIYGNMDSHRDIHRGERCCSPYMEVSRHYAREIVERRRVVTPPLPGLSERNNNGHSNHKRSRSRSKGRSHKHNDTEYRRHEESGHRH